MLAARGARREADQAPRGCAHRPHGQEHRSGDVGDLRGGGSRRGALALRRRGVRVRARPCVHGTRSRPRAGRRRAGSRVPLGRRGGGHLHGGFPLRGRPAPDLPGIQARLGAALAQGAARRARGRDVRPRPLLHGDGRRVRGARRDPSERRRRGEGVPGLDRARGASGAGELRRRRPGPRCGRYGRRRARRAHVREPERRRHPRASGGGLLGAGRRPFRRRHGSVLAPRLLVRGRRAAHGSDLPPKRAHARQVGQPPRKRDLRRADDRAGGGGLHGVLQAQGFEGPRRLLS